MVVEWYKKCITTASSTVLLGIAIGLHKNAHDISSAPQTYDGDFFLSSYVHFYESTHNYNYNYNFVIFAYTRPSY